MKWLDEMVVIDFNSDFNSEILTVGDRPLKFKWVKFLRVGICSNLLKW